MSDGGRSGVLLGTIAAPLFVVMWSTGFIGAKFGLPHAEPLTFLSIRFALASAALALWTLAMRGAWPSRRQGAHLAFVGALLHGGYLGGVFVAIWLGVGAAVSALVVSMHPILTVFLARWVLGERMTRVQWLGLCLGVVGVVLVVGEKLSVGAGSAAGAGPGPEGGTGAPGTRAYTLTTEGTARTMPWPLNVPAETVTVTAWLR